MSNLRWIITLITCWTTPTCLLVSIWYFIYKTYKQYLKGTILLHICDFFYKVLQRTFKGTIIFTNLNGWKSVTFIEGLQRTFFKGHPTTPVIESVYLHYSKTPLKWPPLDSRKCGHISEMVLIRNLTMINITINFFPWIKVFNEWCS